jgi:hypothetical protein
VSREAAQNSYTNFITSECAQVEIIVLERPFIFDPVLAYCSDKQVGWIPVIKLVH